MRFSVPEVQAMRRTSIFSISSFLPKTKKSKRNGLKWTDLVVGWGGLGSDGCRARPGSRRSRDPGRDLAILSRSRSRPGFRFLPGF